MAETLSVEAVNQMRKAMGLPLIPVPGSGLEFQQESKDDVPEGDLTLDERQERGSANFQKLQEEQQRKKEREERKNKLKRERELAARNAQIQGKGIAEVEDDLGATDWLKSMNKRRKVIDSEEKARLEAEAKRKQAVYDSKDLSGLKVAHQANDFDDEAILTFKDRAVDEGDSDEEFELENRELVQKEELAKRLKAKKFRPGAVYNPNEDQEGMLAQYDEAQGSTFTLDASGQAQERKTEDASTNAASSKGVIVSLDSLLRPEVKSDYREAKPVKPVKAKKVKKSKNARKRARDEDEDAEDISPTNGNMDVDIPDAAPKPKKRNTDDFTFEDDEDMAAQLAAARRKALKSRKRPADIAREIKEQEANEMQDVQETTENVEEGGLLIDASTEWANSLDPEALAREAAEEEERRKRREASHHTPKPEPEDEDVKMSYAEAEEAEEAAARAARTPSAPPPEEEDFGDEEAIGGGLGATLKMLKDRHLVEGGQGDSSSWGNKQKFLQQRAAREEDAERRARISRQHERERMAGMSARDREEAARQANAARDYNQSRDLATLFDREYRPNIELKYHDEFGNELDQKQAFKELSHQFHGKGSGKQKQEKRLKKLEEERKRLASNMLDASQFAGGAGGGAKGKSKTAGVRLQ